MPNQDLCQPRRYQGLRMFLSTIFWSLPLGTTSFWRSASNPYRAVQIPFYEAMKHKDSNRVSLFHNNIEIWKWVGPWEVVLSPVINQGNLAGLITNYSSPALRLAQSSPTIQPGYPSAAPLITLVSSLPVGSQTVSSSGPGLHPSPASFSSEMKKPIQDSFLLGTLQPICSTMFYFRHLS